MRALRRSRQARALVIATLLGLLAALGLAHWHAVKHGPVAALAGHASPDCHDADAWVHAAGDATCRLVDQLLVGLATVPAPQAAEAERCPLGRLPVACPAAARGIDAAFLARAPPRG
ncbi:MAG: hypothetical protein H6933_06010 [Burkholderiaceae bacterium]|nr:hypothetical protein [Burkholderiaceae bacterium]